MKTATTAVKGMISLKTLEILEDMYYDVRGWLQIKIEQTVNEKKNSFPMATLAEEVLAGVEVADLQPVTVNIDIHAKEELEATFSGETENVTKNVTE